MRRVLSAAGELVTLLCLVFGAVYFLSGEYARAACFLLIFLMGDRKPGGDR